MAEYGLKKHIIKQKAWETWASRHTGGQPNVHIPILHVQNINCHLLQS